MNNQIKRSLGRSIAVAALGVGLLGQGAWAEDLDPEAIERGKAAAATCVACHQADGSGMNNEGAEPWPRLTGLHPDYIVTQLTDFKEGRRTNASMQPFANMLDDEQVHDVAVYYSSLEVAADASVEASEALLERGRELALNGDWDRYIVACVSCHGPGNHGVGSTFPNISGQHPAYIVKQLQAWKEGERENDPLGLMKSIAQRMTQEDMQAVAAWLGQQPVLPENNSK
ncbi:MAG TPA: c-type cytochrome [Paenalcaligenes sp.]|nr:c-type cytochrome [Paenalcaligenes sp.]